MQKSNILRFMALQTMTNAKLQLEFDLPSSTVRAKPFLKWAGGKGQLLDQLTPLLPDKFGGYHEPFVGSGALFFRLLSLRTMGRIGSPMQRVHLTDSNEELVNCYAVIRDDVENLIRLLGHHKSQHGRPYYYHVRDQIPSSLNAVERAARIIYLNKTCFNGLYRVNRRGQFNVPMGSYKDPGIFEPDNLRAVSMALRPVKLDVSDYARVLQNARAGDFVYFDPPYYPLTRTASFTAYTQDTFGEKEQAQLADVFRKLHRKGCKVMLSNSWTQFILDLYHDFKWVKVSASRAINSKAEGRGKISEVVILSYDPPAINGTVA
jgi:DNA adenine methylase